MIDQSGYEDPKKIIYGVDNNVNIIVDNTDIVAKGHALAEYLFDKALISDDRQSSVVYGLCDEIDQLRKDLFGTKANADMLLEQLDNNKFVTDLINDELSYLRIEADEADVLIDRLVQEIRLANQSRPEIEFSNKLAEPTIINRYVRDKDFPPHITILIADAELFRNLIGE